MKRLSIIAAFVFMAVSAFAQGEKLLDYTDKIEGGYDFLLYVPESYYKTDASLPVVIYLHGKTCTGTDINMVTKYGSITALRRGVNIPALVIAPQVEIYKNGWEPKKVMEVLDYVTKHYRVDKNRIYVFGMSMGGSGTYKVVAAYPDRIAAAITMCGTCWVDVKPIAKVPIWVIHGVTDTATPVSRSEDFVAKMKANNTTSRMRYTPLAGCGHSILARVYMLEKAYKWLMNHSLADEGRPMSMQYEVTPDDLNNAYKNISGKPRNIPIERADSAPKAPQSTSTSAKQQTSTKQQTSAKQQKASENVYHVIEEGDTMYKIAGKYDTRVSEICRLNDMQETDILKIGRKLLVKSKSSSAKQLNSTKQQTATKKKQIAGAQYHTIEEGDTLYKIAGKYDTRVSEICRLNNIEETTILQIGMKLRVK
jgi:LysM repeat protein